MTKIIRGWRQAEKRAGKGRVQLWRDVRAGLFPVPRQLGPNSIGWTEEEFDEHFANLPRVSWAPPTPTDSDAPPADESRDTADTTTDPAPAEPVAAT